MLAHCELLRARRASMEEPGENSCSLLSLCKVNGNFAFGAADFGLETS